MRISIYKPQAGKSTILFRPAPAKRLPPVLVPDVAAGELPATVANQLEAYKAAELAALQAAAGGSG